MLRSILHCDMNNFYASVECMLDPALKKYPIAVCGSVEERHGIVLAKNYKAKAFDVKTGDAVRFQRDGCQIGSHSHDSSVDPRYNSSLPCMVSSVDLILPNSIRSGYHTHFCICIERNCLPYSHVGSPRLTASPPNHAHGFQHIAMPASQ